MRSAFAGFVSKELYHILRDRRTLLVLIGMPIIMMVLFGYAIRNEIRDIRIAVVDPSRDSETSAIVDAFRASPSFEFVGYLSDREAIERAFREGQIMMAISFQPDFASRLRREGRGHIQVIADASNPNTASTVLAYATAVIKRHERTLARSASGGIQLMANPASIDVASSPSIQDPQTGGAVGRSSAPIVPEFRMRYNPELKSIYLFVPGLIAILLMLVSALMTSITITRERETGTMEVLLVSPLHPLQIILGKLAPYLVLSMVNVGTILLLSVFVFQVPIRGSLLLLLAECFLFTLCGLTLGMLISSRSKSLQTATMIALAGLLMPAVLLSGFIFPIESMPVPLQWFSHIIPAKWFLVIVRGIMIRGVGLDYLWPETLVLVGMTLLLGIGSLRSFNDRLE